MAISTDLGSSGTPILMPVLLTLTVLVLVAWVWNGATWGPRVLLVLFGATWIATWASRDSMRRRLKSQMDAYEIALCEANELLEAIIDHANAAIYIKDQEGRFRLMSRMGAKMAGLAQSAFVGKTDHELFPAEVANRFVAHDREILATGRPLRFEEEMMVDGELRTYISVKFLYNDAHGEPAGVAGISSDITERKQAEETVRRINEDLEQRVEERTKELRASQEELVRKERLATLGQLTATVSHELRNPLGAIRPALFMLRRLVPLEDPQIERAIGRIDRGVRRCDHIIDELLDFTRATELDLRRTSCDLWLSELLDELHVPDGLTVQRRLDLSGVDLEIDADRVRRAIINLYENACQAMLAEGEVDKVRDGARIAVGTARTSERFEIWVADNGDGIPADVLPRIFEPLFSTKSFGVGLGLPTVRQILEQHGGGIEIDSGMGKGTRVTLWLPTSVEVVGK